MPHATDFDLITIKELHPIFVAEVGGIDFTKPVPHGVFAEVRKAAAKYGVLVFRKTGLTDKQHIDFAAQFGDLDDIKPYLVAGRKNRLDYDELFDVSNIDENGNVAPLKSGRYYFNKGNGLFHVDSSFNPRRGGYSLLRAHQLPPKGTGGNTEYADTRTAFDELPPDLKSDLITNDYTAHHSLYHSRKIAAPEFFADLDPTAHSMTRHKLVQIHEPSGRQNLYIASHIHHLAGMSKEDSDVLFDKLYKHATQEKYVVSLEWESDGDLICWDNTCVMHRAAGGSYEGVYKRDMRRATVHDMSSTAWGLNDKSDKRVGLP